MKWYYWNRENKIIYQIIISNSRAPFNIKFSKNVSINYKLGIAVSAGRIFTFGKNNNTSF